MPCASRAAPRPGGRARTGARPRLTPTRPRARPRRSTPTRRARSGARSRAAPAGLPSRLTARPPALGLAVVPLPLVVGGPTARLTEVPARGVGIAPHVDPRIGITRRTAAAAPLLLPELLPELPPELLPELDPELPPELLPPPEHCTGSHKAGTPSGVHPGSLVCARPHAYVDAAVPRRQLPHGVGGPRGPRRRRRTLGRAERLRARG